MDPCANIPTVCATRGCGMFGVGHANEEAFSRIAAGPLDGDFAIRNVDRNLPRIQAGAVLAAWRNAVDAPSPHSCYDCRRADVDGTAAICSPSFTTLKVKYYGF